MHKGCFCIGVEEKSLLHYEGCLEDKYSNQEFEQVYT